MSQSSVTVKKLAVAKPRHGRSTPPGAERPRERILAHGPGVLSSAELLAIILRTGMTGCSAVELARSLLQEFGGLRRLLSADAKSLLSIKGLGLAKTAEIMAINELSRRALEEELKFGQSMSRPELVKKYCTLRLGHLYVEHCIALFLDSQYRLIACEELSRGTLTQASVYPREVIKACLHHHAAAMILAHNHPSGVAEPSSADLHLTQHLKKALALVDVRLLDHLIVTPNGATSLAEMGQL